MTPNPYVSTKSPSAIKSLRQFIDTFYVKHKTDVHRFDTDKAIHKAIKKINALWSIIANRRGHTKVNQNCIEVLYHWIIHHPKFLISPISNYFIYASIDGNSERQLM